MSSYADNRSALFGTSKGTKPKPKPQKKSYTLGGQSKAAQQRQRERAAQLKQRGDDFYAAAEALMPPKKTGFAALMAKQPNPLLASSEYGKAADAYAAAGLNEKAIAAYRKAAQCHNESNAPHTAARCLERAALIASDGAKAKLAAESADTWAMAGEPLRGAEVALKLAASLDVDAARQLVAKATDLAATCVGSPHAPELLQKVVGYYCSKGYYREALKANNTLLEALDRARMSEGAPLYRCLAAQTILALADGSDIQKADAAFLESLGRDGYAASKQAQAAEDLLQCFKAPDDQAFDDAVASPALQSLDHAVAQVAKALPRPVVVVESAAPAVAPAPGLTADDADELPDLT